MNGKAAPTAADLQHAVAGPEVQLAADQVEFGLLGIAQIVAAVPYRAGIRQRLVEKQPKELVPQVVVGVDVPFAARAGVASAGVAPEVAEPPRQRHGGIEPHAPRVCKGARQYRAKISAGPQTVHVGLARTGGAANEHAGKRVVMMDLGSCRDAERLIAHRKKPAVGQAQFKPPVLPASQTAEYERAGCPVDRAGQNRTATRS